MRAVILTEGGQAHGHGHVARCIGLCDALLDDGFEVDLFIRGDKSSLSRLEGRNGELVEWNCREKINKIVGKKDIVIVDSYHVSRDAVRLISSLARSAMYIDDNLRIEYPPGTVVNGSIFSESFPYPVLPGVRYLLGSQYIPLRRPFWRAKKREVAVPTRLLVLGGGGKVSDLAGALGAAAATAFPHLHVHVVSPMRAATVSNFVSHGSLGAVEIKELMETCDLAVSAAGQTLYELASMGVPTVAFAAVENQVRNLEGWVRAGFAIRCEGYDSTRLVDSVLASLGSLISGTSTQAMATVGQEMVDGQGARRIAAYLAQEATCG